MNKLTLLHAAAFATGITIPAAAQPPSQNLDLDCRTKPCIQVSRGTIIGLANSYETLFRPIGGKWYVLSADAAGLQNDTHFFYTHADCSGQAYVPYKGDLPTFAWFDGSVIWGPGPTHSVVTLNAWQWLDPPNSTDPAHCGSYGERYTFDLDVAPAVVIDATSHGFHPPFSMR
jgi:hypothetical protein